MADNNLSTGIPARHIGPETGASGNATMTNSGDTAEGTNESHESVAPPAAGLEPLDETTTNAGERRTFATDRMPEAGPFPTNDAETAAQQIADGGDRVDREDRPDHDKR
jgi:hypothetical protein